MYIRIHTYTHIYTGIPGRWVEWRRRLWLLRVRFVARLAHHALDLAFEVFLQARGVIRVRVSPRGYYRAREGRGKRGRVNPLGVAIHVLSTTTSILRLKFSCKQEG